MRKMFLRGIPESIEVMFEGLSTFEGPKIKKNKNQIGYDYVVPLEAIRI
jgi:hypothetical protein